MELNIKEKYNVFISSTIMGEMGHIRKILKDILPKDGNINPILSEFADSFPKTPDPDKDSFKASVEPIKDCHILVLIINNKYGNIRPKSEISITEEEYNEAVKLKIPRIVFIENNVWHDYMNFQTYKLTELRNGLKTFLEVLRKRDYDNPEKLMKFISNIVKLRSIKKSDNWRWIYNKNDINRLTIDIKAQINFYIDQIKEKNIPSAQELEKYYSELYFSEKINNLQNEIENVKEKNENIIKIIKEAIGAMQTIVESLPNKNREDKIKVLMTLEDKMDNLHFFLNYFKDLSYRQWEGPILSKHSTNLGGDFLSGGEVEVLFKCINCCKILRVDGIDVPVPNMHADTVHGSRNFGESNVLTCDCGFEYEIEADSSYADWDINFESKNQPEEFYYRILFDREIEANLNDILDEDE